MYITTKRLAACINVKESAIVESSEVAGALLQF